MRNVSLPMKWTELSRWSLLVIASLWSTFPGSVEASSMVNERPDDLDMEVVISRDLRTFPAIDVSLDAKCTQGANDTYSVIVHSVSEHLSNFFRDPARVCMYSRGVVSAQFKDLTEVIEPHIEPGSPPFGVAHPPGVSKRVRVYHVPNPSTHASTAQVLSHLDAACKDPSETTVIVMTDETCSHRPVVHEVPSACWGHMAGSFASSVARSSMEHRLAYLPVGPRDTFDFVSASDRAEKASERPRFFNVAVSSGTSPRRVVLLKNAASFKREHRDWGLRMTTRKHSARSYRSMLLGSTLTVCPGGHNPETFRMFESLEAGSIPIVSRQDFLYPSYKAPFPCGEGNASWDTVAASPFAKEVSVGSWEELPGLLERLKDAPAEYIDKLQADSVAWYDALMRRSYLSILNFGQGYEFWPQDGPIVLEGFPERSEPYPETPPYAPGEV